MVAKTWVGRFCVADGRVEENGPWLTSLIRQRPDDAPDELYVVVEPATPASADLTAQLGEVIAQLYRKDPLSLTGALTRSLRAAHEHLLDWNRKSLPEHRIAAGATCLAISGLDAYIGQVGPSLAYVRTHDGDVRRIDPDEAGFEHALGTEEDFTPHITRVPLEPGDLLVIASSALDELAPAAHIERILSRATDDVLPEFYLLCKDTPNFALVLLSAFEEVEQSPPDFLTRSDDVAPAEVPLDDQPLAGATGVLVEAGVGAPPESPGANIAASPPADGWIMPPRPIREQVAEIKESAAPPRSPDVRIRGAGSNVRYRRSTGAGIPMPQFRVPKLAVFAALALVGLGLLAYWQLPDSVVESREDRFVAFVQGARESNARAQATSDAGLRRQLLADARAKLDDAAKIHADDPDVLALQADVASALTVLNAVYEVKDVSVVADLAQLVTGDLGPTQIVLGGDSSYVLDAEGRRILRVPNDGQPPQTIIEEGQQVNLATVGRPIEIAWAPPTQSLVVLDDQRQAFTYFPGAGQGTLPLVVRDTESLGSMDAIATGGVNLYVLDKAQHQVWRYLPSQGGFDSERTALLDGVDLSSATDLAVGEDVYVVDTAAGIRRFEGRSEVPFPLSGMDTPMVAPASLLVLPNRVVIADTGNKRIIVASSDGRFIRQIVSGAFTDLRAVSVDEGSGTMYVLNGDTVLRASFPP